MSRRGENWSVGRRNRRTVLRGAALAGAGFASAAFIACNSNNQSTTTTKTTEPQPQRGGTLVDARFNILTGRTLDPHRDTTTSNKNRRLWYQGLLDYNMRTLAVEPELAQKWEQPSTTEFLFTLQPGVKWHNKPPANGRELTAEDIVFSLNRARTKDPSFFNATIIETIDQVTAVDKNTVKITTKRPDAVLVSRLASNGILMLAPEVVEKAGKFASPESCVGTGAFILDAYDDQVAAHSVRNPDYWKAGQPYLDAVDIRYFGDEEQAYSAYLADKIDVLRIAGDDKKDYVERRGQGAQLELYADDINVGTYIMANVTKAPFDDTRITRALRLLADFQELRDHSGKVYFGDAKMGLIFAAALADWDFTEEEYAAMAFWKQPKDAAAREAVSILQAAGFSQSNPLTFEFSVQANGGPHAVTTSQLLQDQWRKNSQGIVNAQIKLLDGAQASQIRSARSFAVAMVGASGAFSDPDPWFMQIVHSKGSRNYVGFNDPEVDALAERQGTIFEANQRKTVVKQLMQILVDRSPVQIPFRDYILNATSKRVHDYAPDGDVMGGQQFDKVWMSS